MDYPLKVLCVGLVLCLVGCGSQSNTGAQGSRPDGIEVTRPIPKKDHKTAEMDKKPDKKGTRQGMKDKKLANKDDKRAWKEYSKKTDVRTREQPILEGSIVHHKDFPSELIRPRPVDVWLPEGYDPAANDRYPVIYMHDGQMMFDVSTSSLAGTDVFWDVDKAIMRLVREDEIRPAIVVAVWMSQWTKGARGAEYMPQKPVTDEVWQLMVENGRSFAVEEGGLIISSDNYLKFLVDELKPFIDENYATQPDRDNTFVMGSSMGGLISAYAIAEYPNVFGGACCLSSHWPMGDGAVVQWLNHNFPSAGTNRVYFDYGTETLDAEYEPYQQKMDEVMRQQGYKNGEDWITRRFEGADHSPRAWRERLHIPLKFLLGKP